MDFVIEEKTTATHDEFLLHHQKLWQFTQTKLEDSASLVHKFLPCHLFMRDLQNKAVAGAYGYSHLDNFVIEIFWVDTAYRRTGLGLQLYAALEEVARKRQCEQIIGSMYDFHGSRAFFEKVGGTCFATLKSPRSGRLIHYVHKALV
jgi:GNAT superfamily N-acetyltransferase